MSNNTHVIDRDGWGGKAVSPTPPISKGRPREAKEPRVVVSASVAHTSAELLKVWLAQLQVSQPKANPGRVLDLLVAFASNRGFPSQPDPKPRKTKKGGRASTP